QRKYDYTYDNTNRLKKADFTELKYNAWINSEKDFSVSGNDNGMIRYDENGNIRSMNQMGVVGTAVQPIDILQYNYFNSGNSNRLMAVTDMVNNPNSTLGDFKELSFGASASQDYGYDANGNLTVDLNKHISYWWQNFNSPAIKYNYLNLPESIVLLNDNGTTDKGNIKFSYDALGNKYRKTVTDLTTTPNPTITVTNYVNGFMFGGGFGTGLDQIATEEGRIRYALQPNNTSEYEYDWFVKDHLGNTRMVLTEQPTPSPTFQYKATFENLPTAKVSREDIAKEKELFGEDVLSPSRSPLPTELKDKDPGNKKCALLKPGSNNGKVPYKILKVNAGDKFNIGVQYYYRPQATKNTAKNIREDILNNLLSGILGMVNAATGAGKAGNVVQQNLIASPFSNSNALRQFTDDDDQQQPASNRPRAYLNYVLMDTAMQFIKGGALRVDEMDAAKPEWKNMVKNDIEATIAGYFLVYISNEEQASADINAGNVYFDNLVIITNEGPILEENHYYPFGLLIHPISTGGSGRLQNKYKYNGKELQNGEFADGSGLEWYDYGARMEDPQIGRWHAIDKESEVYYALSPYHYGGNCPVNTIDIDGNLFIFANGFMVNQYRKGLGLINKGPDNPRAYSPDRGFYADGPRNNGKTFTY
ncbi:MAG: RHS repeat-associated core domain-containing protein, partial [Ferruginibacter sp.]